MNSKLIAVIAREFTTRVRTKGYIIGTLIFPLIVICVIGGVILFSKFFAPSSRHFYVIDNTGKILPELVKSLPDTLKSGELKYQFTEVEITPETIETKTNELKELVINKKIYGYLIIPEDIIETREVKYSARNVSDYEELEKLRRTISRIVGNLRLADLGLSPDIIRKEMSLGWISLISHQVTSQGEISKHGSANFLLTYLLSYMMFLFIIIYGQTVTRSVIEEKSQRITETIISSIRPVELMLGKMIGICLLGITQIFTNGLILLLIATYGKPLLLKTGVKLPDLISILGKMNFSPQVFGFMILYFLMGYLFYAAIFAAIGAMVNTEDEGQQFLPPVIIVNVIGFLIMISVARNPDTVAAFWASLIPFFTPVVMFARISVSDPVPPSGTFISILIMILSIFLIIKLVAKIYRVGILMYGKKPSLKETLKWIRYK